jgi:hypothetical protein
MPLALELERVAVAAHLSTMWSLVQRLGSRRIPIRTLLLKLEFKLYYNNIGKVYGHQYSVI